MASSVEPVPGPRVRRAVFAAAVLAFLLAWVAVVALPVCPARAVTHSGEARGDLLS
jgi:hypothetical protein